MRFLDLFAGIGGFRLGMEQAGHECAGYVEWDKFARKSYQAIHDTEGEWTANDITTVTNDDIRWLRDKRRIDIICGGFPCQAFSIAGKRGGFDDARGTLFFEIMRFANIIRPRYLFLENVKGLLNHDQGITFETILRTMDECGYDAEWQVLNSSSFGVPQNRERVFIIGHLRGSSTEEVFPLKPITNGTIDIKLVGNSSYQSNNYGYRDTGISATLCARDYKGPIKAVLTPKRVEKRQNGRRIKKDGEPMFTLTAQDLHGVYDGDRVRVLTPKEYWRLQGFPDWAFDKAAEVNSDSQLYKQAGNSVTVNVIYEIAKRLV